MRGPASGATFDGPQAGLDSTGQTLIFVRLVGDPGAPVPGLYWYEWDGGASVSFHDETARFDPAGHWSHTWQVCDGCEGDPDEYDDSEYISLRNESYSIQYGTWVEGKAGTYTRIALRTPTFDGFPSGEATEGEPMVPTIRLTGGTPLSQIPPYSFYWINLDVPELAASWPDHSFDARQYFDASGNFSDCCGGLWHPDYPVVWEGNRDRIVVMGGEASYGVWRRRNGVLVREPLADAIEAGSWGQIKARFR
jgi:hypothetical protein